MSLSEKDLQRRTERELENWRKARPNSTFDPRGRCQGYLMAWERVKEMEEKKEKQEKEKGNLSLPLLRSPSSLSPSLLRKKWTKRGSRGADDGEGSAGEQMTHGDKREKDNRKHSDGSTSSMDSHHQTKLDIGAEEPAINTPHPSPSKEGSRCRTYSDGSVAVAGSEQAQTHTHTDQQSRPPNRNSGITIAKEGPSESDENREEKKIHTQSSHEEGEGHQQKGISEEDSPTEKEKDKGRVEEMQEDENKQNGPEKTELDNKTEILKDKEELIVDGKEETLIVEDKPEEDIQILTHKLEEEAQLVEAKQVEEKQTAQGKLVEAMQAAENRPEAGMQSVKVEEEEEAIVTHEPGPQSLKDELEITQSHIDLQEETRDSLDTKEGQTSADQEEWQRQEDQRQDQREANTPYSPAREAGQIERGEVTHMEVTCEDDLHTKEDEQSERVEPLSTSKQEEEVQPDKEIMEKKGEEDKEETDVSSPGQALQPRDSVSSLGTPPVEDLNSDPPPPQPKSSPDADLSAEMENSQTDVGPLLEGENQHTHSTLVDRHSKAPTATKPTVEEQDQPQEKEAMTEAAEGRTECTDHETQEQMVVMEETMGSPQEKASVNTSTTSTQEICSSFSSRPQSTIDPNELPQSLQANKGGQATETVLSTKSTSSTKQTETETDTSKPPHGIEIHPDNQFMSEEHRLSQSEKSPHTAETENRSDIDTSGEEVASRPEGEISKTQEAEETSDPIGLPKNNPGQDRTELKELREESEKEKIETIFAEEKTEHAGTEAASSSPSSNTKSIAERDSVASLSGAETADITPFPEPVTGATRASEAQPPPTGQVRVRRYSSSRSSYPRVLSEDIFKDPRDIPLEDNTTPPQPQSPAQTDGPFATPIPESTHSPASQPRNSSHTQGTTQTPKHTHSPSKSQTLNPVDIGKLTESPKRLGLFQRLRGGTKSSTSPKMTIPKILIQDFSEEAEDEAQLSSKERRKRRRERERREKEEEKLRKKQEKEREKEQERERKKPQTRGKSFQLPSSTFRAKDSTLKRSESQNVVSRRNSTPLSDNYF